ncbi:hypothetical protein ACLOJK_005757 [Asimina triloba]
MILSSTPFSRKFKENDPVLKKIDHELLRRQHNGQFTYGGWCSKKGVSPGKCSEFGRGEEGLGGLRPGAGARRLRVLITKMLNKRNFKKRQCG